MTETPRVFVVGEALVEGFVHDGQTLRSQVGGSPLNVAVGVGRLGHPVTFACSLADDDGGAAIAAHLAESGVELARGSLAAGRTSYARASIDARGEATYEFDIEWDLAPGLEVPEFGHLHTGSIAVTQIPGSRKVNWIAADGRAHATISYDPNVRPNVMGTAENAAVDVEALARMADVVKASVEDVAWLWDGVGPHAAITYLHSLGPRLVVITMGQEGVLAGIGDEVEHFPADKSVAVVDTVGAGDSFMAGLISGLLEAGLVGSIEARERLYLSGMVEVREAIGRAIACANITVSRAGANPPQRAELPD